MEKSVSKKRWAELTAAEKTKYYQQANFLINKGYSPEKDIETLARTIYKKLNKKEI